MAFEHCPIPSEADLTIGDPIGFLDSRRTLLGTEHLFWRDRIRQLRHLGNTPPGNNLLLEAGLREARLRTRPDWDPADKPPGWKREYDHMHALGILAIAVFMHRLVDAKEANPDEHGTVVYGEISVDASHRDSGKPFGARVHLTPADLGVVMPSREQDDWCKDDLLWVHKAPFDPSDGYRLFLTESFQAVGPSVLTVFPYLKQ